MGKARSYEIIEYRNKIISAICESPELVKLLGEEKVRDPEEVIPWKWVFPHEFIPDTITEMNRYINFEISTTIDSQNNVYKDISIYFYILSHQDVIHYKEKGRSYLWYDKVVCELDNIFNEHDILGIGGTMQLVSNIPYFPQQKFKGRVLKFVVKDFNNGLKYGK
jgi:hypothetical protein